MATPKAPLGVHVRILDFGLARMLGSSASISDGVTVGTPSYMAPEQCRGDTLDHRLDIYACGVVLFEMLTGRKPFVADEPIEILKKHLQDAPPKLADVAPGDYGAVEGVVARALAKAPADRYPSAVAMADALEAAIAGRKAADTTAQLAPANDASIEVPITVGSSVHDQRPARAGQRDDTSSALRRSLPRSRARWWALLVLVLALGWGVAAFVYLRDQEAEPIIDARPVRDAAVVAVEASAPTDPTAQLVANAQLLANAGKVDAAIDLLVDARKVYPDRAVLPATAGKLYFSKLWWADGIVSFRAAIRIDPKLREDPEILDAVVRGFTTTPGTDGRLGALLVEIGAPAASRLEAVEQSHPNPGIRARAGAMRKRLR
jgi:serine/threonine-protein kinase